MKVVIEKEESNIVSFEENKNYLLFRNFVQTEAIGYAKISLEEGIMYAKLKLNTDIKGYPSIGYIKNTETGEINLKCVAICDNQNTDESIELIEYKTK